MLRSVLPAALVVALILSFGQGNPAAFAAPVLKPHHTAKYAPPQATFNLSLLTPDQLADKIAAWASAQAIPDLQQAIAVGTAAKETVVTPCWQALLTFAQAVNSSATVNQADASLKVHLATDIETFAILQADLLPNGPLKVACAPAAQALQQNTANLIGGIVTGVTSISTLVPMIFPGL